MKRVYVTDDYLESDADSVVSLPLLSAEIDTERYSSLKKRFERIEDKTPTRIPLLDILWKHFLFEKKGGLLELALLYEPLLEWIRMADPDTVVADVTDPRYKALLEDVQANCGVTIQNVEDERTYDLESGYATELLSVGLLLLNQVLFVVGRLVHSDSRPDEADTVIFPYPGRESSTRPVIESLAASYVVVVRSLLYFGEKEERWDEHDPKSLSSFATLQTVRSELLFLGRLCKELLVDREMETALSDVLQEETGHDLRHSVRYAVLAGFRGNISNLVFAVGADTVFSETNCDRVVVGGNSPQDRALLAVARARNLDTYYVPHSIAHPEDRMYLHHPDTTMFVASDFDKQYLKNAFNDDQLPTLVVAGRPYFQDLDIESPKETTRSSDRFKVMLATQDGPDRIRTSFLEHVLRGIDGCRIDDHEVVVKIHPDERVEFYEELLESLDIDIVKDTTINDSDLNRHLKTADLVVTINSNVGIESMYVGTPCLCVNLWEPVIPTYPYASAGPAPVCRTQDEVREFFGELTWSQLETMTDRQREFAESYRYDRDTGGTIAAHIENRQEGSGVD